MNEANISGRYREIYLAPSSRNRAASEDLNLPIDDRRKVIQTITTLQLISVE